MKKIFILFVILLTGCASNKDLVVIENQKVKPDSSIMKDCLPFFIPIDGKAKSSWEALIENRMRYELCVEQNKQKKVFIENNL